MTKPEKDLNDAKAAMSLAESALNHLEYDNCFEEVVGKCKEYEAAAKAMLLAFADSVAIDNPRFKDKPRAREILKKLIEAGFPDRLRGANYFLKSVLHAKTGLPSVAAIREMKDVFVSKLVSELAATDYRKLYEESVASARKIAEEAKKILANECSVGNNTFDGISPVELKAIRALIEGWPFECPYVDEVMAMLCRAVVQGYSFVDLDGVDDALELVSWGFGDSDGTVKPNCAEAFSIGVDAMLAVSMGKEYASYDEFEKGRLALPVSNDDAIMSVKPDFDAIYKDWAKREIDIVDTTPISDQVERLATCIGVSLAAAAIKKSAAKK